MSAAENKAVFLSYASQDAEAAKRIADALRSAGVEVWFDQSELVGGDAWDAKIRKQIGSCALFVPLISANSQARREGYFRLEWRLAVERMRQMDDDLPFLLPVVIDGTKDAGAHVPDRFRETQWTRLPGGETTPAFVARVQKLLGGSDAGSPLAATSRSLQATPLQGAPSRQAYVLLAGAAFAIAGAAGWWVLRDRGPAAPIASANTAATMPVISEARKLAAKARELTEADVSIGNPTRDDLALAESFCKQAMALDQNDAEIWATYSLLSSQYFRGNLDSSSERKELARTQAERALKLAPHSFEARYAKANYLRGLDGQSLVEAEALLRELTAERPGEGRVLISLGKVVWGALGAGRNFDRAEEALALFDRAAAVSAEKRAEALGQRAWLLFNLQRYAEAEASFDEAMRDRPTMAHLGLRVVLALARSDLAKGRAMLAQIPDSVLQTDQGVGVAAPFWLAAREPAKCLALLNTVSRDYISSNTYIGTVDGLRGDAYELAGRADAARNARQIALRVVERRLVDQPRDGSLLGERAKLLAQLGERGAAVQALRLFGEIYPDPGMPVGSSHHVMAHVLLDPPEQAITLLESSAVGVGLVGQMRVGFHFDALRGNPRFQALLQERKADTAAVPAKVDDKSVAVLPFANLSGDREQEYFSDGLTEEILNTLARERDLRVPGRASSFSFKGKNISSAEIAKALNVSRLVEGSVRKSGNKVRISVSLTRAADGFSEELGTFTEELSDIFALQDKVARVVVEKITRRTAATASVSLTRSPEAYDAYLRGRAVQTRTPRLMGEAIQHYERAVALDPGFALAWARLAEARFRTFVAQADRSPAVVNGSREAIDRALAAQPDLPEALIMRANWVRRVQGGFAAARRDLDRVESLHPVTADLRHAQAQLAQELGQFAEAFRLAREALQLDPQNGDHLNAIGTSLCLPRGEFVEADQLIRRAIVLQGSSSATPFVNLVLLRNLWRGPEAALRLTERWPAGQGGRGAVRVNLLMRLGRLDEARQEFDRLEGQARPLQQDWSLWFRADQVEATILVLLGREELARKRAREIVAEAAKQMACGNRAPLVLTDYIRSEIVLGHRESALKALEEWHAEAQREPSIQRRNQEFTTTASRLYALLGKVDEAVALLQELQANGHIGRYGLADNPEYASLRGDPRFQEIVRQYEAWRKTLPDPVDL